MKRHLVEMIAYRAYAGLRAEAARAYLGLLWWILEPVLYMAVFYVVFVHIFQRGGENYIPFLLIGLVVWKWFGSTVTHAAASLQANAGLMQQVYVPKFVFPLITVAINTVKFLITLILLAVFLNVIGIHFWQSLPVLFLLILLQCLFIAAAAMLLAAITPFIPDLRQIIDNAMVLIFFLSGVFFDLARATHGVAEYLRYNPMYVIITLYRDLLLHNTLPAATDVFYLLGWSLVMLLIALFILVRYDRHYLKTPMI